MTIRPFRDRSLRTRMLVLLLAASALPTAVALAIELVSTQALIEDATKQLLDARADQLAGNFEDFHRIYSRLSVNVASLPRIVSHCAAGSGADDEREGARSVLASIQAADPHLRGIALFATDGTVTVATEAPLVGRNYGFRSYFRAALSGTASISDVYVAVAEVQSVPSIAYAAPVRASNGTVAGVVAVYVRAQAFWDAVRAGNGRAGEGSYSVVFDRHAIRIAHSSDAAEIFRPGIALDPATIEELVNERRFGEETRRLLETPRRMEDEFRRVIGLGTTEMLRGYSPTREQWSRFVTRKLETVPWTLFFVVPEPSLTGPLESLVRRTLVASAAVVVLALAAGLFLTNGLVRSIDSLSAAAAAVKGGDMKARVAVADGAELETLAAGFNAMAEALASEREHLAERVRERTAAHARANEELERQNRTLEERTAALTRRQEREVASYRASIALAGEGELAQVVQAALREAAPQARAAVLACYRVVGNALVPIAGFAGPIPADLGTTPLAGFAGEAVETRKTIVVEPVPEGASLRYDAAVAGGGPRCIALVPLVSGDRSLGLLVAGGLTSFESDALGLFADIAAPLTLAIMRHDLLQKTRAFAADLAARNEELRVQSEELRVQGDALRAQQQELARFFSVSLDLLCVASFDGKFTRVNPAWTALLGWSEAELLAQPFLELVHPDDRAATVATFERILAGAETRTFENRYRAKDGSHRWLLWSATPVVEERVVYAAARDVTARRLTEERLRAQAEELRGQSEELRAQAELLEAKNVEVRRASELKSEFLASVSHELRTPLNAIIGFSELLVDGAGGPLEATQLRYVEDILASGRHLLGLINDILDLVKIEAGRTTLHFEVVPPDEAIANALVLVEPLARRKRVTFEQHLRATEPVLADRARLKQILLNLLSNAVKFGPEGSSIEVGAEDAGEFVRFWVRDRGAGMDPELVSRLFRPFVQGKTPLHKNQEGTGLGLAISKGLVEQHGGLMEVESVVGQGSTFRFTLARATAFELASESDERPVAVTPPAAALARADGPTPTPRSLVLLVTDSSPSASLLQSWLTEAGHSVRTVSGEEALALAERLSPAVILIDLIREGDEGLRVLQELKDRATTRHVPVVIASLHDEKERGIALGAADYLTKPLDRSVLLERIEALVERRDDEPLVLAIDDDPSVGALLGPTLERAGYRFLSALTGSAGLELARSERPALVIVDLVLPDTSGFDVVDILAKDERTRTIPIFVLTARDLDGAERERLRRHVRTLAEKGDLTRDALLAAVAAATRRPGRTIPPTARSTILVVDDHDVNRELVRTILERLGHRVIDAADGEAGVEVARRSRPDLIFMDLAMPRKDGFQAAHELKSDPETKEIPIVALTAFAMRSDERRVREAGFDGYLTKPIDLDALRRVLGSWLRRP